MTATATRSPLLTTLRELLPPRTKVVVWTERHWVCADVFTKAWRFTAGWPYEPSESDVQAAVALYGELMRAPYSHGHGDGGGFSWHLSPNLAKHKRSGMS